MSHIFVSHATLNNNIADKFALALEKHGFTTWIDHRGGLEPGAPNWDRTIRDRLHAARAGVLLMSPASLASDICEAECLMLRELGKPLYVVYIETAKSKDIWLAIKMIQYADCRTDFDTGVAGLARALRGETAPDIPTALTGKITGSDIMRLYLPYLLSVPLTGREKDIAEVQNMLGPHVTQITAIGGMGKSRLAAEIAQGHTNGAVWHRCSPESAAYQVVDLLRDHFHLSEKLSFDQVLSVLSVTPPLIVLDNAETIPDDSERRAAYVLLAGQLAANGAPLLLTSRNGWADLKPRKEYSLEPITAEEAGRITLDFATAENITLSETNARELAEAAIWHPRLIEFAMDQIHEREFQMVLRQLRDLDHHDVQERLDEMVRQTLRQMTEQANHGVEAEQLLRHLTAFRGTFSRNALEALAPSDLGTEDLDDALAILRRWRFVSFDQTSERYSIPLIVKAALGEEILTYDAHYSYYLALAQEHDKNQDYSGLDPDSANLEVAFERKMAAGEYEDAYWICNACSFFQANRGRYDQRKIWLEKMATALEDHPSTELTAGIQNDLGILYQNHPLGNHLDNLRRAIVAYQQTLVYRIPDTAPLAYAMTQNNLGNAYYDLARIEDSSGNLHLAITAYEQALIYRTSTSAPLDHAQTQNNLGNTYYDLAGLEDREANLHRAITAYKQALDHVRAIAPLDYASMQNNLGTTYRALAGLEDQVANLRRAIAAYEQALIYRTPATAPLDYAQTQNNLGNVYSTLAKTENHSENLRRAIAAYEQALVYRTPATAPLAYAVTQNNLGNVYSTLAKTENHSENLCRAIAAYKQALIYRTPDVPLVYATTQNSLGDVYSSLAETEDRSNNLRRAIAAYEQALIYRTSATAPLGYATTQGNIGATYRRLSTIEDRSNNLRRAITAYEQALIFHTPTTAPLNFARTQANLGIAYKDSNDISAAIACWHEAEYYFRQMKMIDDADKMLNWITGIERRELPIWRWLRRLFGQGE